MNSLDSRINLTDDEITAAFDKIGCGAMVDCDTELFTVTNDTLADVVAAAANYKAGRISKQTDTALVLNGVQVRAGDQRRDLFVIDFGAVRVACRF